MKYFFALAPILIISIFLTFMVKQTHEDTPSDINRRKTIVQFEKHDSSNLVEKKPGQNKHFSINKNMPANEPLPKTKKSDSKRKDRNVNDLVPSDDRDARQVSLDRQDDNRNFPRSMIHYLDRADIDSAARVLIDVSLNRVAISGNIEQFFHENVSRYPQLLENFELATIVFNIHANKQTPFARYYYDKIKNLHRSEVDQHRSCYDYQMNGAENLLLQCLETYSDSDPEFESFVYLHVGRVYSKESKSKALAAFYRIKREFPNIGEPPHTLQ